MSESVLWIVRNLPGDEPDGGYLRYINLARAISAKRRCFLAVLEKSSDGYLREDDTSIFEQVVYFDGPKDRRSLIKHLRLSNINFLRKSDPEYLARVCRELTKLVKKHDIRAVIGITIRTAEILSYLPCSTTVVDDYDCVTLTLERSFAATPPPRTMRQRVARYVQYRRIMALERSLTSRFSLVTTISADDQNRLRQISVRNPQLIQVVKNGVNPQLLDFTQNDDKIPNSIVFWGNLSFPPNYQAVTYFHDNVYVPYLRRLGIKWYIVGGGARDDIKALAKDNPDIELTGFIADLAGFVSKIPVMINPMISGSGLKNKVLEAFALRCAVVSTDMGASAIEADPGVHYLLSQSPKDMAEKVTKLLNDDHLRDELSDRAYQFVSKNYRWEIIGKRLLEFLP